MINNTASGFAFQGQNASVTAADKKLFPEMVQWVIICLKHSHVDRRIKNASRKIFREYLWTVWPVPCARACRTSHVYQFFRVAT